MYKFFILLFFLMISYTVYGQQTDFKTIENLDNGYKYEWKDNKIGFSASMLTGYGFTYYRQLTQNLGVKAQIFAYGTLDDETSYANEIDISGGIELQYTLLKFERIRFYALTGGYYMYNKSEDYFINNDIYEITNSKNIGIGVGCEMLAFNNLSFAFDGGYYFAFINKAYEDSNIGQNPMIIPESKKFEFSLGVAFSVFYSF